MAHKNALQNLGSHATDISSVHFGQLRYAIWELLRILSLSLGKLLFGKTLQYQIHQFGSVLGNF